jgi:uncharacterized membrane protein YvlD (DUF360 family)
METIIVRVLEGAVALFVLDLLIIGFAFGFGAFLVFSAVIAALLWGYHRYVIQRQPMTWQWERFGSAIYRMEVA